MKFSVIIPVYNKAVTLPDALDSVLSQTEWDFEIVVVDDGSRDDIGIVSEKYPEAIWIRQQNSGVSVARNTGIKQAKGDYICFLDADDLWLPNHLETLCGLIVRYPQETFFSTSHIAEKPDGKVFHSGEALSGYPESFVCQNLFGLLNGTMDGIINTNSVCIERNILLSENYFFEPGKKIGEDTDLWYRIGLKHSIVISKTETTKYRQEYSTATKKTRTDLNWAFADRIGDVLKMEISEDKKRECVRLIDRYKMTCSRAYMAMHDRKKAKMILGTIKEKSRKLTLSKIYCLLPYRLCGFVSKYLIR